MIPARTIALLTCSYVVAGTLASAQTIELDVVGSIPGPADGVRVSGTYAYVAAGPTLSVVHVGEPSAPKARGAVTLPGVITAFAVSGTVVYATVGLRGLAVVDVSNPDTPIVVGILKTPGEAVRIAVAGSKAVVANRMSGAEVVDVSDRTRPVSLGSYYTDGYTRDVAAAGSVAYVVDSSNDFAVVDLSRNGPPAALTIQQSVTTSGFVAVSATGGGKIAYVLGGGSLQTYDVSDAAAPKRVAASPISGRTQAVVLDRSFGYVAAGTDGVQILDLSDPLKPIVRGAYRPPGAARDVAASGDLIFVVVAESREAGRVVILRRRG